MKRVLFALCALLVIAACTKEMNTINSIDKSSLQTIQVSVAPFGKQTKTAVSPQNQFTWSAGDQIGIYPVNSTLGAGQTSQQIVFKINGTGAADNATFTGTGWGLITSGTYKYYSYYPYSAETKYNEATVEFKKNSNQATNDTTAATTTAHLGVNDYLYAPQIQPADAASCSFAFKHLGALVRFKITVPDSCSTRTFKSMEVVAEDSIFTVIGKYDPSSATSLSAPVITRLDSTNKLTLSFNGATGFGPNSDKQIDAYFLIAPTAIKDKNFTVTVYDENDYAYTVTKTGAQDLESGMYKKYNCTVTPGTGSAVNLSSNGTANCYIVPDMGRYRFLANVRGNGVDPVTDDSEGPAIDVTNCTAEVIWETFNTNVAPAEEGLIVKNVEIVGEYIEFNATGTQGNALIALKNSSNQIVWSWHIWSTSADLEAFKQTYPNGTGVMMDRNLGALSAQPGNGLTLGFHYQWGRPFPITGGCSNNGAISSTRVATTNSSVWVEESTDATKGTLAYSAANPTHFIYASASNFYKGQTSGKVSGNWLWTADATTGYESGNMPLFWGSAKTMYDPCPVGWKVPAGDSTGVWFIAGFRSDTFIWNASEKGRTFNSPAAYYPAAGFRGAASSDQGGSLNRVGSNGFYWSSSSSTNGVYTLYFTNSDVNATCSYNRAFGFSVRPVHE